MTDTIADQRRRLLLDQLQREIFQALALKAAFLFAETEFLALGRQPPKEMDTLRYEANIFIAHMRWRARGMALKR